MLETIIDKEDEKLINAIFYSIPEKDLFKLKHISISKSFHKLFKLSIRLELSFDKNIRKKTLKKLKNKHLAYVYEEEDKIIVVIDELNF